MLRRVTVKLSAYSSGSPVFSRMSKRQIGERLADRMQVGLAFDSADRDNHAGPAWVMSTWTEIWRSPPSTMSRSRNSGCSIKVWPCVISIGMEPTEMA